ncbi:MAG: RagB/SusD family nutrient uptake outer membrane protein [Bacteroides sp.]
MKYSIKTLCILLAIAAITFTSCNDFLDRQEDEKLTFEKIWESRYTTEQYWLNTMSFLPNDNGTFVGDKDPYLGASDEATVAYDRAYRYMNFGSWNASLIPYYRMDAFYKGIRECNIFMQNVDRCSDPLITKAQLAEWKWQTRFARAYYYFLMMRDYGPVFLLGDELLDFSATTEALQRPRSTWEQCVDYVVSEMTECINSNVILSQDALEPSKYGLATKGTCYAVISRLKLYSARDLFNGNKLYSGVKNPMTPGYPDLSGANLFPQQYNANKWLQAADAAKILMDQGTYKLYRAGNGDPYEDYYGITHKTWNSELIWTDRYNGLYAWGVGTVPTGVAGTAYGAVGPTQQQVDAYAMSNGRYPIIGYDKQGNPTLDRAAGYEEEELAMSTWTYPAKGWSKHNNFQIESPNMYKDREPRFYVSVFFGGNKFLHGPSATKISFAKGGNGNKSHDYAKTGYLCNRFYDHMLNSAEGNWGNITFPLFRLGEIYLNFIESVLECKKHGVALPGGYEKLAMDSWADLRDRAGLEPITKVYPQASTDELIELCRKERRIELTFERHRYFDTRTWMIAEQTDNGPMYGMDTNCPLDKGMSGLDTPKDYWKRTVVETRVFKKNHYLHPFAQRELDRNKLLIQNYGW